MKIKAIISSIIMTILILVCSQVNATIEATVNGECVNIAKPGEKVEYKLKVKATTVVEGIDGIVADIKYPEEVLLVATSDDIILMEGMLLIVLEEPLKAGEEKDIIINFTVNSNTNETEAMIELTNIVLTDTDQETSIEIPDIKTKVQIQQENEGTKEEPTNKQLQKIEITKEPTKKIYKVGEKVDLSGSEIVAIYSDGTTKVITDYTYIPSGELKESDKIIEITYTENGVQKTVQQTIEVTPNSEPQQNNNNNNASKDSTVSDKNFVNAGLKNISIIAITILLIASVIGYTQYRKNKQI